MNTNTFTSQAVIPTEDVEVESVYGLYIHVNQIMVSKYHTMQARRQGRFKGIHLNPLVVSKRFCIHPLTL